MSTLGAALLIGAAASVTLTSCVYWLGMRRSERYAARIAPYVARPRPDSRCSCDHLQRDHAGRAGGCMELVPDASTGLWRACGCEAYNP